MAKALFYITPEEWPLIYDRCGRLADGLVPSDLETAQVREPFRRLASALAVAIHAVLDAMPLDTQERAQVDDAVRSLIYVVSRCIRLSGSA